MRNDEHKLQKACVEWFRLQYPRHLIFAIPNGGRRNAVTGAMLKEEGVVAGVADLFIMASNSNYYGLFIEMKTPTGRQNSKQKDFQQIAIKAGYQYIVCHSLMEFINEVNYYFAKLN